MTDTTANDAHLEVDGPDAVVDGITYMGSYEALSPRSSAKPDQSYWDDAVRRAAAFLQRLEAAAIPYQGEVVGVRHDQDGALVRVSLSPQPAPGVEAAIRAAVTPIEVLFRD